jgi:site-specific DNA-methyltransferase (adenine-specific)
MIYNEDFFTAIDRYDIKNVDLVVTSPPYYTARNYGGIALFDDNPVEWIKWCYNAILKLSTTLKETGVIWWNTGSGYKDHKKMVHIYGLIIALHGKGIELIDEIPWIKKTAPPKRIKNRPFPAWEHNFILAPNPSKVTFYRDNVRQPYSKATLERMKYRLGKLSPDLDGEYGEENSRVSPNPGGATPPNYLILSQDYSKRPHPAPMTPDLANWAIRAYSNEGDLVFDPMAGIGTTWVESIKLNRNFIGCELFPEYIEIAKLSVARLDRGDDPYNGLKKEWNERKDNS